uniref:Uncharacterized protein n=1 Tax=Populus alba TaxID=43335 RepID=A0A4U5QW32_POPAL|nr:hypothetical protein D5086_0000033370 [Populus alba]
MVNMVIRNLKDRIERKEHDVGIDSLQNKADLGGNNVRRRESYASPIVDNDFNEVGDKNYNSAPLSYEDQFGHPRNRFEVDKICCGQRLVENLGGKCEDTRQLFHYKGQMDRLKAGRDSAHEAIFAIFFEQNNNKPAAPAENLHKRMQGFGNTSFEMPFEDRKSFLVKVVRLSRRELVA